MGSKAAVAVAVVAGAAPANAIRDYENIGYLGGGAIVDVNNANIRAYLKMPGMYPAVGDLYKIAGLSSREADVIKKYESRFTTKPPSADYVVDRVNNGLYR